MRKSVSSRWTDREASVRIVTLLGGEFDAPHRTLAHTNHAACARTRVKRDSATTTLRNRRHESPPPVHSSLTPGTGLGRRRRVSPGAAPGS